MLEENAELTSRLIDVALTSSHNDVFDAAFGGEATSQTGPLARLPLGHWSQEEVQRRHKEATEEVRMQPLHNHMVMGRARPSCGAIFEILSWDGSWSTRWIFGGHTSSAPTAITEGLVL